ncbi:MAG: penicillin acylase family protein [Balneolales bacterium]
MRSILKLVLLTLILVSSFILVAAYLTFYSPLPRYETNIKVGGVQEEVTIHRDGYGIPHIFANNSDDLYFSLGYAHAQDRIWQMTISQMVSEGRFSEFLGKDFIELDKYLRMLNFPKTAKKNWLLLTQEQKKVLESYTDGVNSYMSLNKSRLPIEFALTDMKTIPWKPQHSLSLIRIMAWEMNNGWWNKAVSGYLQTVIKPDDYNAMFGESSGQTDTTGIPSFSLMDFFMQDMEMRELFGKTVSGSSAWVADGSITEKGYPVLGGDTSIGKGMAGSSFEVHLNLNDKNVSGVTIPGIPAILQGQNDDMAWALTEVMADETDFFIEKLNPANSNQILVDSIGNEPKYIGFLTERSTIKVRESHEVIAEVHYTPNGTVVSDFNSEGVNDNTFLLSMRWTGMEPSNEMGAFLSINWAESFTEFQSILPEIKVPAINIIYGDVKNNIAMYTLGSFPQRSNPHKLRRGWIQEDEWKSYIPFRQLPRVINPDKGWIANANNKTHYDAYPFYLTSFWDSPFRYDRIQTLLTDKENIDSKYFMDIQNDIHSNHALEITQRILPVLLEGQNDLQIETAISYLTNWDFNYARNAAAATIMEVFLLKLGENTIKQAIDEEAYNYFIQIENLPEKTLARLLNLGIYNSYEDRPQHVHISNDDILNSMKQTIEFLEDSLGTRSYEWRWENMHTATFTTPIFNHVAKQDKAGKAIKLIVKNILNRGPYPASGNGMTINKGTYMWEKPFEMTMGGSSKRIIDLSEPHKSYSVLSSGQSGNPISEHYDNQIPLWLNGRYRVFHHHQSGLGNFNLETMTISP